MHFARDAFWSGVKEAAPVTIGAIPFATITGVAAVNVGIPPAPTLTLSAIAFAGASQLAAFELIGRGAPAAVVVLTALVINLRYVMYSASIAPHFQCLSLAWKVVLGWLLVDQVYAVSLVRFNTEERFRDATGDINKRWFFMGMGLTIWLPWIVGVAAGVLLGVQAPASWSLDFVISLIFVAILFPVLRDGASVAAALTGGAIALLGLDWPLNLGLLIGAVVGIAMGLCVVAWGPHRPPPLQVDAMDVEGEHAAD